MRDDDAAKDIFVGLVVEDQHLDSHAHFPFGPRGSTVSASAIG